jgi:hypothetical protein
MISIAHPMKIAGRVVLGPRQLRNGLARIVAHADGSGRIEVYDMQSSEWRDAEGACTFSEIWSAPATFDARYLALT